MTPSFISYRKLFVHARICEVNHENEGDSFGCYVNYKGKNKRVLGSVSRIYCTCQSVNYIVKYCIVAYTM